MALLITVACVCVGTKYDPTVAVEQLRLSVRRHLHTNYEFVVLTDNPQHPYYHNIKTITVDDWPSANYDRKYWWYKMQLFKRNQFRDDVLYLDLDTVITGKLYKFLDYEVGKFGICQDFNRKWIKDYTVCNSSVMRWHAPSWYRMYDEFVENMESYIKDMAGDQDFITQYLKQHSKVWWPTEWAMSFKWELYKGGLIQAGAGMFQSADGVLSWPADKSKYAVPNTPWVIPSECSVAVFHGDPNPWDTDFYQHYRIKD